MSILLRVITFAAILIFSISPFFAQTEDEKPTKIIGNSTGNLMNDGYVTGQGEWVYFYDLFGGQFSKLNTITGEKTDIREMYGFRQLNLIGDTIYFAHGYKLSKMNVDGNDEVVLDDEGNCYFVSVADDYIYYVLDLDTTPPEMILYKMKLDGTGKEAISGNVMFDKVSVIDDYIYYISSDYINKTVLYKNRKPLPNEGRMLHRVSLDGTVDEILAKNVSNFIVLDDRIYYSSGKDLLKVKIDGTENTMLKKLSFSSVYMNAYNDKLYFWDGNGNIREVDIENPENLRVIYTTFNRMDFGIVIVDGKMYEYIGHQKDHIKIIDLREME